MRKPTPQEVAKFRRACKALDELGRAGFGLYLANDTMNLMTGDTHSDNRYSTPQRENSVAEAHITGAGGGDW